MSGTFPWSIVGSYYESCNCDAVCPCRRQNGRPGGRSTYKLCQFVLSWAIHRGSAGAVDLNGLMVAMAGFYDSDEIGEPWSIKLYIDEAAADGQFQMLESIFLGRAGGDVLFTANIAAVFDVERAAIVLDHRQGHEAIRIGKAGGAHVIAPAKFDGVVTCGIPGHDHPGVESVSSLNMRDAMLQWDYEARCGFATDFAYKG